MKRYLYIILAVLSVAAIAYAADTKFKGNVVVTGSTTTAGLTNSGATTNTGAVTINGSFKAYSSATGLGKVNYGAAAGQNTITVTLSPAPTAYKTGMFVSFKAYTATASGAATLNVNSLGAKSLKKLNDVDPGARCLEASHAVMAIYDGTNFQLVNPCAN